MQLTPAMNTVARPLFPGEAQYAPHIAAASQLARRGFDLAGRGDRTAASQAAMNGIVELRHAIDAANQFGDVRAQVATASLRDAVDLLTDFNTDVISGKSVDATLDAMSFDSHLVLFYIARGGSNA